MTQFELMSLAEKLRRQRHEQAEFRDRLFTHFAYGGPMPMPPDGCSLYRWKALVDMLRKEYDEKAKLIGEK